MKTRQETRGFDFSVSVTKRQSWQSRKVNSIKNRNVDVTSAQKVGVPVAIEPTVVPPNPRALLTPSSRSFRSWSGKLRARLVASVWPTDVWDAHEQLVHDRRVLPDFMTSSFELDDARGDISRSCLAWRAPGTSGKINGLLSPLASGDERSNPGVNFDEVDRNNEQLTARWMVRSPMADNAGAVDVWDCAAGELFWAARDDIGWGSTLSNVLYGNYFLVQCLSPDKMEGGIEEQLKAPEEWELWWSWGREVGKVELRDLGLSEVVSVTKRRRKLPVNKILLGDNEIHVDNRTLWNSFWKSHEERREAL